MNESYILLSNIYYNFLTQEQRATLVTTMQYVWTA